jgi:hypothetical protein
MIKNVHSYLDIYIMKVSNYGRISGEIIEKVFDGKIDNESDLCSDGLKGYKHLQKIINLNTKLSPQEITKWVFIILTR